jgi:hypothetical protein
VPRVADTARIPPQLRKFRAALILGEHATGVEVVDLHLAEFVQQVEAQAEVTERRQRAGRPDPRDVEMSRIWDNFVRFERMIAERPLGSRPKHAGRPWDARTQRPRTDAPGGMGTAGRSPQDTPNQVNGKIHW